MDTKSETKQIANSLSLQPFAFDSRDFLRKAIVGRVVNFKTLYTIPTTKREYGMIELENGARLPDHSVAEGWVKLRDDAGRKDDSEDASAMLEKLKVLEARSKADSKGVWSEDTKAGRIDTEYELADAKAFVEEHKGKPLDGMACTNLGNDW